MKEFITPVTALLEHTECFVKFSKYMSWLLRQCTGLLHKDSVSLTLHELLSLPRFRQHIQYCTTFILGDGSNVFGDSGTTEIFNECKKHNINVDSMRWFIPFVTVVWHNSKGRIAFSVMNTDVVREPIAEDWCTPHMSVDEILRKLRHNGGYKTNNVFFRAQSGHATLAEQQRPGRPYNFRHDILIHKTATRNWKSMSNKNDRCLRCMGRDIHFAPMQFLWCEAHMLRQYGEKVLLFNMHNEETKDAFRTARESENGYILVSENINLARLEAVFDLDTDNWTFCYDPVSDTRFHSENGIEHALNLLHYYPKVEHNRTCYFDDLPLGQRQLTFDGVGRQLRTLPQTPYWNCST